MDPRIYHFFNQEHPCLCIQGAGINMKTAFIDAGSSETNSVHGIMYSKQGGYSQRPTSRGSRRQQSSSFNLSTGMAYERHQEPKRKRPVWPWIFFGLLIIILLANSFPRNNAAPASAPVNSLAVEAPPTNYQPTPTKVMITQSPITPSPKASKAISVPAATATPVTVLGRGMKSDEVKAMQEKLIELGYLKKGQADGVYGRDTLKAVESFQLKNDLKADGVAGEKTLALLYSGNAKKK